MTFRIIGFHNFSVTLFRMFVIAEITMTTAATTTSTAMAIAAVNGHCIGSILSFETCLNNVFVCEYVCSQHTKKFRPPICM